jgi:tRNA A37 methylthiotransferase MiaB
MDICLVTAPVVTEFRTTEELDSEAVRSAAAEPHLGILSLAAVLEASGRSPEIVNLDRAYFEYAAVEGRFEPSGFAEAAAKLIVAKNTEICGFSSICSSYPLTIRIAEIVKAMRPETRILLGGPQASVVDTATVTEFPFVDLVLRGEAERTILLLVEELEAERKLERVPGLTYRHDSKLIRNPNAPVIQDLDSLPSPAYHLTQELRGVQTAALEMGRGCPFSCTFCSTNDFFRRNFRLRSPERVLRDMRSIAAEYQIRDFTLAHDMFTVDRRRVAAFCEAMIASGEGFTWSCSARTDCIDEELLQLMASSGCRSIFFGVETGSQRMQKVIDKHLDLRRAEEIVEAAEKLGIATTVSLITGFPEETWEDVRQTMEFFMTSARCAHSNPQLNLLAPLAATPIYSKHKDELVLTELCSDMSHQSLCHEDADLKLISRYPEIFPNFYLLPVPHLNRRTLFELHEFALVGVARFRWLLCAIHQTVIDILSFFLDWRDSRLSLRPTLEGADLRQYYRTPQFRLDFLTFVQGRSSEANPIVEALLEYEEAVSRRISFYSQTDRSAEKLPEGASLRWTDIPSTRSDIRVIELSCDIQAAIEALKLGTTLRLACGGPHFYAKQSGSGGTFQLVTISDWMARLFNACDGKRTMEQALEQFSSSISGVDQSHQSYVFLRLLGAARTDGTIALYRPAQID